MFELIKNPNIDFMSKNQLWVTISAVAVGLSLVIIPVLGINLGIEFTGGAEIQVKYAQAPDPATVRAALDAAGIRNHLVTTISDAERKGEKDVYIRVGIQSEAGKEEDLARRVVTALRQAAGAPGTDQINLNATDEASIRSLLEGSPDLTREQAASIAAAIARQRRESAVFRSVDDVAGIEGMTPAVLDLLKSKAVAGPFAVRSQSYVGPAIGRELIQKAFWAVVVSMGAMLVYIGFRFRFQSGAAAVVAMIHDTIVTLGLFSLFRLEMSLPVVAAFLTLIGYSVNDTVVIFDRLRENLQDKRAAKLSVLINQSVNQTLSRSIITSGLTWLACLALLLFGGEALRPFSFVLVVGIIVGSYSTIFVASPLLLFWERVMNRKKRTKPEAVPAAAAGERKAKKVRTTPAAK